MKTQMEDIRNNADITPNRNDIRNNADIRELYIIGGDGLKYEEKMEM